MSGCPSTRWQLALVPQQPGVPRESPSGPPGSPGTGSGRGVEGPPAATGQTRRGGPMRDGPSAHRALDSRTRSSTADTPTVQDPPDGRERPVRQLRDLAERKTSVV